MPMGEFFIKYYLNINQLSWIFGDAAFVFGILFIFGNFDIKSVKSWMLLILEWIILWALEILNESFRGEAEGPTANAEDDKEN